MSKSFTITIGNLDTHEADHISSILSDYKNNMTERMLEAMSEDYHDGGSRREWYEEHLKWHETIMKKVQWSYS
jgi:hypothetical protein